jgi:hypothetical protein
VTLPPFNPINPPLSLSFPSTTARLRSDLGGTTALLTQQQDRLASATARRRDLQSETSAETASLVQDIMDLRGGDLLAADFEDEPPVAVDTPVSDIVDAAVLMELKLQGYATYSEAYKAQRKRFEKAKKKAKGACPCCQREMSDAATQQAYETSSKSPIPSTTYAHITYNLWCTYNYGRAEECASC